MHDLENLDGPAECTRVLCAATQSMERMYHECNQLREQAATPNEHIEHRFLAMRAARRGRRKALRLVRDSIVSCTARRSSCSPTKNDAPSTLVKTPVTASRGCTKQTDHTRSTRTSTAVRRSTAQLSAAQATATSGACRCCGVTPSPPKTNDGRTPTHLAAAKQRPP